MIKREKAKLMAILLVMLLVISNTMPNKAVEIGNLKKAPILIETETIKLNGNIIRLDTYNDNGVKVCVAIPEESIGVKVINNSNKEDLSLIMEDKLAPVYEDQTRSSNWPLTVTNYENTGTSNNGNCEVYHRGYWEVRDGATPFIIQSTSMYVRGAWNRYGSANKIKLNQTVEASGVALSISAPAGFSVGGSSNIRTWSSAEYETTPLAYAYTGDYEATSLTSLNKVTVSSSSDVYPTNASCYVSRTSSSKSILGY